MAVVVTQSPNVGPMGTVGSFIPVAFLKATTPGTTTVDITVPGLSDISGAIVQVLDSGDRVATSDADITWSGNVITIADGGSFSLADTQVIYIIAWGTALL